MENIIELTDSNVITNILNKAFMTVALEFNFTKENAPRFGAFITPDRIEYQLHNGLTMYGYTVNDQLAGCAGFSFYKDQIYLIERLATLPEYRHLGIGRKLMNFTEHKIAECNGTIAEVHVVDINLRLINWYKRLGYNYIRVDIIGDGTLPFNSYAMNKNLEL